MAAAEGGDKIYSRVHFTEMEIKLQNSPYIQVKHPRALTVGESKVIRHQSGGREREREKVKRTLMIRVKDVGQRSLNECQVLERGNLLADH